MKTTETSRPFERAKPPLSAWPDRTPFQKIMTALLTLIILSGFIFGMGASPTIDEMPTLWKIVLFSWGILFGGLYLISTSNLPFSRIVKIIMLIGPGVSFVSIGEVLRDTYVFSRPATQTSEINAPIIGSTDCIGLHSRPRITVEPYPGKTILIKTSREICEKFKPRDIDGHECVKLQIETGMYGIRRVLSPLSAGTC